MADRIPSLRYRLLCATTWALDMSGGRDHCDLDALIRGLTEDEIDNLWRVVTARREMKKALSGKEL